MDTHLPILILAAGHASRMGELKQLLPLGDSTLLGQVCKLATDSRIGPVHCVLGNREEEIRSSIANPEVQFIYNPHWQTGLSSSIRAGMQFIRSNIPHARAVLFLLGDQPMIPVSYLTMMQDLHYQNPGRIIASDYGKKLGVPVLFPASFFPDLEKLKGDRGAQPLLLEHRTELIVIDAGHFLRDVDSPEDYQAVLKEWQRSQDPT